MLSMVRVLPSILTLFVATSAVARGGIAVGGGGNVIMCSGKAHFQSLDYVIAKHQYGNLAKLVSVGTLDQSFDRIARLLRTKFPPLASSFSEYRRLLFNRSKAHRYVWRPSLIALNDTGELYPVLPITCRANTVAEIRQAVIRNLRVTQPDGRQIVELDYDPEILELLKMNDRIQLSFLLVHEWLWDFTETPEQNRYLNFVLHSELLEAM